MIKQTVAHLVAKFRTNDPFELASLNNILVLFEPLGEMLGYFNTSRRLKMIHINAAAPLPEQRFTCAHELGHVFLHPKINTPFLHRNTLLSVDRIEREANAFAVELLIPDEMMEDGLTIYKAAAVCGVPEEVAHLKKVPKRGFWRDDDSYIKF